MPPLSESLRAKLRQQIDYLDTRANKQLKLEQGRNTIRFCPSWKDEGEYYYMYFAHFNVSPSLPWMVCPKTVGRECQVCELAAEYSQGGSEDQKRAAAMRQTINYATNAILVARDNRRVKDPVVKVFNMPVSVFRYLSTLLMEEDVDDFTDPKEGYDIHITKTGTELQTRYTVVPARGTSSIPVKGWRNQLVNLEAEYRPKTDEEIYRALGGVGRPRSGRSDSQSSARPTSRQSSRPQWEEDERQVVDSLKRPRRENGNRSPQRPSETARRVRREKPREEDDAPF